MIAKMFGIIDEINDDNILLSIRGIYYEVMANKGVLSKLKKDQEITLFIYDSIKEDSRVLYGFISKEDKDFFKFLINIRGIGEKTVTNWMSEISTDGLKTIFYNEDLDAICKLPKVGKKTGEKILTEIKHKIKSLDLSKIKKGEFSQDVIDGAKNALISIGYNSSLANEKTKDLYEQGMNISGLVELVLKTKK